MPGSGLTLFSSQRSCSTQRLPFFSGFSEYVAVGLLALRFRYSPGYAAARSEVRVRRASDRSAVLLASSGLMNNGWPSDPMNRRSRQRLCPRASHTIGPVLSRQVWVASVNVAQALHNRIHMLTRQRPIHRIGRDRRIIIQRPAHPDVAVRHGRPPPPAATAWPWNPHPSAWRSPRIEFTDQPEKYLFHTMIETDHHHNPRRQLAVVTRDHSRIPCQIRQSGEHSPEVHDSKLPADPGSHKCSIEVFPLCRNHFQQNQRGEPASLSRRSDKGISSPERAPLPPRRKGIILGIAVFLDTV